MSERIAVEALGAGEDLLEVVARASPAAATRPAPGGPGRAGRSAACGSRGWCWRGRRSWPGSPPRRRRARRRAPASRRRRSVTSSAIQIVPPSPGRVGVDRLAEQAAPEAAAVLLPHLALDLERLRRRRAAARRACRSRRSRRRRSRPPSPAGRAARRRPAEDRLEARVGLDEAAVAGQGDADRGALEDRRVLEPRLLGGGDVAGIDDHVVAPVHGEARRRDQHRGEPAGAGGDACRQVASMRPSPSSAARSRQRIVRVVPEAELVGGAADHLFGGVAGELAEGRVDQREAARVGLVEGDAVRAGGEQLRQHRLRAAQRRLGGAAAR